MEPDELKNIQVHKSLLIEFEAMKKELEEKTGYPIRGGNPVISKLVAKILKDRRENNETKSQFEIQKIKGIKKKEILFL
jgi:hypothetical protein